MKTVQKTCQVFVRANVQSIIAHHVGNGRSITLNGTGLYTPFFEQMEQKVRNLIYRGRPEVHLVRLAPSDKNGPF